MTESGKTTVRLLFLNSIGKSILLQLKFITDEGLKDWHLGQAAHSTMAADDCVSHLPLECLRDGAEVFPLRTEALAALQMEIGTSGPGHFDAC